MARLNFEQKIVINGQKGSWPEKKAVEDWTWNRVKHWSFIFACLAAAIGFLLLGYWLAGGFGCNICNEGKKPPAVEASVTPPAFHTQAEAETVVADLAKDLSDLKKVIEQTAALATTDTATTAVVVAPPPPKAEKRVPVTKQAEPPGCPCPPKVPTVDQNPPPTPALSSAERRRNEMWSALRR